MSSATGEVVNFAADYKVRRSKNAAGEGIQHVRIDIGTGSTEDLWDGSISSSFSPVAESAVTTESIINVATSNTAVLAANASRTMAWVKNISDVDIYVSFSATATTSKPTKIGPGESLSFGNGTWIYTGAIAAIHASTGTKNLEVVEL